MREKTIRLYLVIPIPIPTPPESSLFLNLHFMYADNLIYNDYTTMQTF